MMAKQVMHLLGFPLGLGGADLGCGDGPFVVKKSSYLTELIKMGMAYQWDDMIPVPDSSSSQPLEEAIGVACLNLAHKVSVLIRERQLFSVIGGDHTSAIGTWSGAYDALHHQGDVGLIWVDAHMDSHTPETTESGRIHGMPLACLMGYGYPTLTSILGDYPKLKPENTCLIGVRSFESGEAALLKRLNVRVYFMSEVSERGFATVLREAADRMNKNTIAYGISIDLDSIDPEDAPGVDVPEIDGIRSQDFYRALSLVASDPKLIGTEIVEFDPHHDRDQKTEKVVVELLKILFKGKGDDHT